MTNHNKAFLKGRAINNHLYGKQSGCIIATGPYTISEINEEGNRLDYLVIDESDKKELQTGPLVCDFSQYNSHSVEVVEGKKFYIYLKKPNQTVNSKGYCDNCLKKQEILCL